MKGINLLNVTPIRIEWNHYNGYMLEIFHIESCVPNLDNSLFGLSFSKTFLYIDILFFTIKVYDKNF